MTSRTHLQDLESESIQILREAVSECERPVMLYSVGKDSSVMLHLALKAFYPSKPPFPLLHVDTTWKFREMYAFRDTFVAENELDLLVYQNPECVQLGINPFDHGSAMHTDMWKTEGLKQALDKYGFDLAFGGARRDEEKSRAKERIFSIRSAQHRWDPKQQRPELWRLYNARKGPGESVRVFPLSNWTELDVWQYIHHQKIPIVPLYYAAAAAGGRARRHAHHGRRRPDAARCRRGPAAAQRPLPHPGLLPADRRGRERRVDPDRHHPGDAPDHLLGTAGPGHRPRLVRLHGEEEAGGVLLMSHAADELLATDIDAYLERHEHKSMLRFITCGSVDDGKSTLIGRLLYDSKLVFEDHLAALESDSKKVGTQGGELDFALLVDGLAAEREQGITIDVAYRFFSTERRKFIVADTPGHEQYTRNMVTGASTADLAVILIDARKGVLTQTRRHSFLVSLLGIKHIVLAINKLDLVDYSQEVFDQIEADYREFARGIGLEDIVAIPLSALRGRQHHRAQRADPLVHRAHADRPSGDRRGQRFHPGRPVPDAGAVGQPAQPRLPRLLGRDRRRQGARRRHRAGDPVRTRERGRPDRHLRRRPPRGSRGRFGHHHPCRRDRHQPRRRARLPRRRRRVSPTSSRPTWCG